MCRFDNGGHLKNPRWPLLDYSKFVINAKAELPNPKNLYFGTNIMLFGAIEAEIWAFIGLTVAATLETNNTFLILEPLQFSNVITWLHFLKIWYFCPANNTVIIIVSKGAGYYVFNMN